MPTCILALDVRRCRTSEWAKQNSRINNLNPKVAVCCKVDELRSRFVTNLRKKSLRNVFLNQRWRNDIIRSCVEPKWIRKISSAPNAPMVRFRPFWNVICTKQTIEMLSTRTIYRSAIRHALLGIVKSLTAANTFQCP